MAVGGFGYDQPAAWTSADGESWERLPLFDSDHPYQLREVEAGGLGWVVLAERSDHRSGLAWASPDGECWVPLPEQVSGREAAVGEERMVIAEHGSFPVIWVGVPTGGDRLGCN
jgi:hypothetical protein